VGALTVLSVMSVILPEFVSIDLLPVDRYCIVSRYGMFS